ncbi:MAG: hypothetical protein ACRCWQ_14750 [Bacilli bacterium]
MSLLTNAVKAGLGTAETIIYTTPAGKNGIVLGGNIANIVAELIRVDIVVQTSGSNISILKGVAVPPNASFSFSGLEQKVVLKPGDKISMKSSVNASADVFLSMSELEG